RGAGAAFLKAAAKGRPVLGRLHALWGLGQIGQAALAARFLADDEAEVRAQAAKVVGDGRRAVDGLEPLLRDPSLRVRAQAAMALGKTGRKEAANALFEMLRENADRDAHLRHAAVIALTWLGAGGAAVERAKDPSTSVRVAAVLVLRRLGWPQVARFLDDPEPAVVLEAARAIHDAPVNEALPALAALLERPNLKEPVLLRALNAAFRTGRAAELAVFASRPGPEPPRVEALRALAAWASPSGRDRLLHLWRPLPPRDAALAREALLRVFPSLLGDPSTKDLRAQAVKAAVALEARAALPAIAALLEDRAGPVGPRVEAIRAMAHWKADGLAKAVSDGLTDPEPALRREAIALVAKTGRPDAAALLERVVKDGGAIDARQAAVLALGEVDGGEPVLRRFLADAGFPPELRLELLEAAAKRPSLKAPAPAWADCLEGGDAEAGQRLFFDRGDLQCLRCHSVGDRGGTVGPALTGHGTPKSRDYLLEALVEPNKTIAQGYGQTAFQLESGDVVVGRIEKESEREVVLVPPDGPVRTLAKASIRARKEALSAMPEDLVKRLTRREVRDLVEFLSTLR
ncbi:MAG TPA: HEAT repeat domain-containing protein, partial [Planctomycetota bacterium]|nr:HEAT repeat domain-containing protein [Planctomycetota bacterium]